MTENSQRRLNFSHDYNDVEEIFKTICNETKHRPTVGIICGSGLSSLGDIVQEKDDIPYEKIKKFPASTVPGHTGKLVLGVLNDKTVVMMQGRTHLYEGYTVGEITLPVRVMAQLGVKTLIVTNAAGGLNQKYSVGDIMIVKDHINLPGLTGENPLRGANDERFGTRFPALSDAYDRSLVKTAMDTARELGYGSFLQEGVYCAQVGPAFETPAECRFLNMVGADAVGMSTVHEVVVARHSGIKVLGISLITNVAVMAYGDDVTSANHEEVGADAVGMSTVHEVVVARHAGIKVLGISLITNVAVMAYGDDVTSANHQEVLEVGRKRSGDMQKLVSAIVGKIDA